MFNVGIPSGSNDGSVYFVTSATGNGDIYRWDQQTDMLQRITASENFEGNPLISLDNEYLYFTRERMAKSTIVALDVGSRREHQVTESRAIDTPVAEIAGGQALLFSRRTPTFGGRGAKVEYMAIGVRGKNLRATRVGEIAVADCTGRFILAWNDGALWRIHADDLDRRTRVSLPFDAWPMAIASDGNKAVVSKQAAQWTFDSELFHVDIMNGNIVQFGVGHEAVMDSEGGQILFAKGHGSELHLYAVEEGRQYMVMNEDCVKTNLRMLADGQSVIFASITDHRGTAYDIRLFNFTKRQCTHLFAVSESVIGDRHPR
jgi:hypothetical protein